MPHGGKRAGAGRKPKVEEQVLADKLEPMEADALQALKKGIDDGERWAVTLYMAYRYGKPKEKRELAFDLSSLTDTEVDTLIENIAKKIVATD